MSSTLHSTCFTTQTHPLNPSVRYCYAPGSWTPYGAIDLTDGSFHPYPHATARERAKGCDASYYFAPDADPTIPREVLITSPMFDDRGQYIDHDNIRTIPDDYPWD